MTRSGRCGSLTVGQVQQKALEGSTHASIAREAGVSRSRVSQVLRGFRPMTKAALVERQRRIARVVKADWVRRKSIPHTAEKLGISPGRVTTIRRSLGLRGRAEPNLQLPVRHPDFPFKLLQRKSRPGEWLCWSPFSRRSVRVARFLAERRLGRALRRDEWAVLKDGDNDNLTDENVLVCSPVAAGHFVRQRTMKSGDPKGEGDA